MAIHLAGLELFVNKHYIDSNKYEIYTTAPWNTQFRSVRLVSSSENNAGCNSNEGFRTMCSFYYIIFLYSDPGTCIADARCMCRL